ncbi:hypothetical protein [Nostoc sp. CHAB 5715]|nr:hypothetical protein [Nostoc sp. CHAB 5715]MCC5624285.1 hypothetical protein [Nostoc sp. CHAB 5715]
MSPTFHSGEDTLCSGSKKRCFVGWARATWLSVVICDGVLRSPTAITQDT